MQFPSPMMCLEIITTTTTTTERFMEPQWKFQSACSCCCRSCCSSSSDRYCEWSTRKHTRRHTPTTAVAIAVLIFSRRFCRRWLRCLPLSLFSPLAQCRHNRLPSPAVVFIGFHIQVHMCLLLLQRHCCFCTRICCFWLCFCSPQTIFSMEQKVNSYMFLQPLKVVIATTTMQHSTANSKSSPCH